MTGTNGHFEQGRWVEDPVTVQSNGEIRIDERVSSATTAVIVAMNDVANVTRDLVASEEGKQYIENTLMATTKQVQRSFEEILTRTKTEINNKVRTLKQAD